jgi:ATP-dependent Clp protease protease subunit
MCKSNAFNYIDDKIDLQARRLMLDQDITAPLMGRFIRALQVMSDTDSEAPITLYINSEGGDVIAGLAFIDALKLFKAEVNTVAIGEVSSMALMLFLCGKNRAATENAKFLHHQSSSMQDGRLKELKEDIEEMEELEDICTDLLVQNTKKGKKFWEKSVENGDFKFNADQALRLGVIHEVLS